MVRDASEGRSEWFFAEWRETDECFEEITHCALTTAIVGDATADNGSGLVVYLCTYIMRNS
jgi:23S rRNA C2498 (ribose-2'-O)-methylase RlmM